ncbi:unspecified product [Leptomonas pyrrhocoris]|uniref:Unspecified product n=1 Tax=Leptomonas pyrrhocoris TaxID=157538 RepID=A0A0N1J5G4_LEPPY|nr:unspecified product [Leptomonas pyrrhocoris]XP_015664534.1 unspecified product [Leptomonas pyrrhocoris]KPA86094.1 unspecified product [Leptomonas pyrrhocoris]KPA86095.1 unspecified product [Leptomonas pyrrhocoris]|eukprot:XP_015664533.1 unspecified product [Leptomonas pyrrhocoris]
MQFKTLLLVTCCFFVSFVTGVTSLNIAVVSSGTPAQLFNIHHIIQAADQRNHNVVVLVNSELASSCEDLLGRSVCLALFCPHPDCQKTQFLFSKAAQLALRKDRFSPNVVLAAAFVTESFLLSRHYSVPLVMLADTGAKRDVDGSSAFVSPKSGAKQNGSFIDSVLESVRGFYEDAKISVGLSSDADVYATHHIITQGIPGLDLVESICPNVHPVGFLRADSSSSAADLVTFLPNWSPTCSSRFIYASISAEDSRATSEIKILMERVADVTDSCVLWYSSQKFASQLHANDVSENSSLTLTDNVLASPSFVLNQYKPFVVISDSIDGVLRDAVFIESPTIYIGTDQAECQQVENAGVGHCTTRSSLTQVVSATVALQNSTVESENIRRARRMGFLMGGARKALDVIELAAQLGAENTDFFCESAIFVSSYGYNGSVVLVSSFVLGLCAYAFSSVLRFFCLQTESKSATLLAFFFVLFCPTSFVS